jgi:molecular chaperone DnaK
MARVKIDYGIDLGTTNSAIARMENGEVRIIKSDIQKDTTPSCDYFRKNTIVVGDTSYSRYGDDHLEAFKDFSLNGNKGHDFNTFIEFKRTMGTDKTYESKSAGRSFNSEELSAEVLKTLKNYIRDEEVSAVVISVPARFRNNQIDATQKAAELSGFKYCELLMEPIAASIAYGVNAKTVNGYWLVFDFGGGTFDVALMRVEEGIMKVVDTDGDNHLGGKDLDYAVVDNIIIPYLKNT